MRRYFVIAAALCSLTACRQNSRYYHWGTYEQSVAELTQSQGLVDVDAHIVAFVEQIERTRQEGGRIPPGLHAHLGLLYSLRGELDFAQAAFESEQELYPESVTFLSGVIERMGARQ